MIDIDALEKAAEQAIVDSDKERRFEPIFLRCDSLLALIAVVRAAKEWRGTISDETYLAAMKQLDAALLPFTTEPKGDK